MGPWSNRYFQQQCTPTWILSFTQSLRVLFESRYFPIEDLTVSYFRNGCLTGISSLVCHSFLRGFRMRSAFSPQRRLTYWRNLKPSDFTPLQSDLSALLSLEILFLLPFRCVTIIFLIRSFWLMLLRTRWNFFISNLVHFLSPEKLFSPLLYCIDCFGHKQAAFHLSNIPGSVLNHSKTICSPYSCDNSLLAEELKSSTYF